MNAFSELNTKDKYYIYSTLLCLFLTTFPLAQGWIRIGDFIPRALFLMVALFLKPSLFMRKDILLLFLYFAYTILMAPDSLGIGMVAEIMQFLIPVVLANFLLDKKNNNQAILFGKIALVISVFIMVNTIIVDNVISGIVRSMVQFSADGDLELGLKYTKMGVSLYSFAMISMCLAPVLLYLTMNSKNKLIYFVCLLITIYFVNITGITTCLLLLVVMVVLYFANRRTKERGVFISSFITLTVLYFTGFAVVEFMLPFFEGTNFYSHLGGLMEFYGRSTMVENTYDVAGRVDLYKYSLDTFLHSPLLGNPTGKIGGHNFFLDHFAHFGIVGMLPFFLFMYIHFKSAYVFLYGHARVVYIICIIGFIALGFLKGMNGIDFWTYMFVYIPCILKFAESLKIK